MLKNFTIRFSLVIIYLILSSNFIISKENNNLLIINSYNNNVTWSGSLVDSILNSIHKVENNINIEVLNLNLNEFISEEQASNTIEFTLKNTNNLPGNIIIIGDDALDAYNKTTYYNNNIKTIVVSNYNNKVSNNNQIKVGYPIPVNQNIEIIRYFSNYDEIIYIEKDSPLARKTFESIKKEANANNLTENIKAIFINKKNLDSLYNIITENSKINRVIITSMWDFTDPHSLLTSTQEDSILIRSNIPIITLMPNSFSNTHIVGGYNLSINSVQIKLLIF